MSDKRKAAGLDGRLQAGGRRPSMVVSVCRRHLGGRRLVLAYRADLRIIRLVSLRRRRLYATGYQQDPAGEWYFLCPDAGIHEGQCMITDARGELQIAERYDFENHRYVV